MNRTDVMLAGALCCLGLTACGGGSKAQEVTVDLSEWAVAPTPRELPAGRTTFVARNRSTVFAHELAVLRVEGDEKKKVTELGAIDAGKSKTVTVSLKASTYELACLMVPGESGSTVDHFAQGMHTLFIVR